MNDPQMNDKPRPDDPVAAAFDQAMHAYVQALAARMQQAGTPVPAFDMLVRLNLTALKVDVLLSALHHCAASGEPLDLARYNDTLIAQIRQMAEQLSTPAILIAGGGGRKS